MIRLLENGDLEIMLRAESPDGMVGDGLVTIHPDHEEYEKYLAMMREEELEQ